MPAPPTPAAVAIDHAPPRRPPAVIKTRPSLDFSVTGLVYCSMMMFMGLAAINTQANLLFGVFGLMIGVLLVSGVISRWVLRHVRVRRILPEQAAVGSPMRIDYEIDNRKKFWPTLSLTIAELDAAGAFDRQPATYLLHAHAGGSVTVSAEVVPVRRGLHRLERYQIATSFPFGFIKRALIRRQAEAVLVHPAQGAVEPTAMSRFFSASSSGINQRPVEGGNDEFYGAREYRPGDPLRTIHWRRSARLGGAAARGRGGFRGHSPLVVKQMTRVSPPRLMLLVDTFAPPPAGAAGDESSGRAPTAGSRQERRRRLAEVERNLAVAASVIAAADRRGLSVGLLLWQGEGAPDPAARPAGRRGGFSTQTLGLRTLARRFGLGRSPALPAGHAGHAAPEAAGDTAAAADAGWLELRPERGKRHRRDLLAALAGAAGNDRRDAAALTARGASASAGDTTTVLVTAAAAAPAANGSARVGRGRLVTIPTRPDLLDRWVRFDADLDFEEMVSSD